MIEWQMLPSGIRLSYLDWPGDGPIALLLHGGDSDAPQDESIGTMVDDIAAFTDAQDWSRFNLVGMSLGGCVAGHFAATDPGRLASLTFIDVGPKVNFESTASMRQFFNDVPSGGLARGDDRSGIVP